MTVSFRNIYAFFSHFNILKHSIIYLLSVFVTEGNRVICVFVADF
jgi:hypothetical protein